MGLTGFTRFRASAAFLGTGFGLTAGSGATGFTSGAGAASTGLTGVGFAAIVKSLFSAVCSMIFSLTGAGTISMVTVVSSLKIPLVSSGTAIAFSANRKSTAGNE